MGRIVPPTACRSCVGRSPSKRNLTQNFSHPGPASQGEQSGEEANFSHIYEDNYRPVKREITIEKAPNQPFGAEFFVYQHAVFVAFVIRDSPAFRAGLQFGDQVISIAEQVCVARSCAFVACICGCGCVPGLNWCHGIAYQVRARS